MAASGFSAAQLIARYAVLAQSVTPDAVPPVVRRDPDDDQVLACARAGRADLIVSGDKRDLLPLGSYEGIPIVSPAEALIRTAVLQKP